MVPEITSSEQVHDQVEVFSVLEGIIHVDQEWTVKEGKDLPFVHD